MNRQELLRKTPGLLPHLVRAWERQGYLRPEIALEGGKKRKEYTDRDLRLAQGMMLYYRQGMSSRYAYWHARRQLGLERDPDLPEPNVPAWDYHLDSLQKGYVWDINAFFRQVFKGEELSLEEMCQRAVKRLKTPKHQETLREFLYFLPLQEVSPGRYKFRFMWDRMEH